MDFEKSISSAKYSLNEISNGDPKSKKNKFGSRNYDALKFSKKKKLLKESGLYDFQANDARFMHYENKSKYMEISANPEFLPSTPKIFQKKFPEKDEINFSDDFFLGWLTYKSFDNDVNVRFSQSITNNYTNDIKKVHKIKHKNMINESGGETMEGVINKNKTKKIKKKSNNETEKFAEVKEKKEETSHVNMYKVSQKKALIFHLQHPSKIIFHGELKVTLLFGEVEILGYTLSLPSGKTCVDVYSPNFCTPLAIESKSPKDIKSKFDIKNKLLGILSADDTDLLLSTINPDDSILMIERTVSNFGIVINKYFDKQLFPRDLENVSSISESLKTVQGIFYFKPTKKIMGITKNPQWENVLLGQCTVLCGGKGAGKSTLLRYYINKLVTQNEKVLCLDFDPGQPEFTPPGCLSAVVVDKPLLGPNFTHLIGPRIMLYFGAVDVCLGPTKYLEYINYLVEYCRSSEELSSYKWFVNTIGFNKGLGIELMMTILKLIKPDTVIQLKCSDHKRNYPFYFTTTTVNSRRSFRSIVPNDTPLSFNLHVFNSCAKSVGEKGQGTLKPSELRDIQSISYFSQMTCHPYYNFNAVQPYLVSFSKLYLGVDSLISPNDILKAFNGNIVSFSNFQPDSEEILTSDTETDKYFKIVIKPSITPCLGLGIVRGVDCTEKKFYLITHLSVEALENVNCLTLGKISPPHSIFLKQDTVKGQTVYTSVSTEDTLQNVKRMFRVPAPHQNTVRDLYESY